MHVPDTLQESEASDSSWSGSDTGPNKEKGSRKQVKKSSTSKEAASDKKSSTSKAKPSDKESDDEEASESDEEDDGIVLDKALFKSDAVRALENNAEYQRITKMTKKTRREAGETSKFKTMREPMRSGAKEARDAYARARESEPDTPDVREILKVRQVIIIM